MWPFKRRSKNPGSKAIGVVPVLYGTLPRPMQDTYVNKWPHAVTQYGARVTNTWYGNQMPGVTTFIPGVAKSYALHVYQRNRQLTGNVPLNPGANIQGMSQARANILSQYAGSQYDGSFDPKKFIRQEY